jgi:hypothetical protein
MFIRRFAEKAKGDCVVFPHHATHGFAPVHEELPAIHDTRVPVGGVVHEVAKTLQLGTTQSISSGRDCDGNSRVD